MQRERERERGTTTIFVVKLSEQVWQFSRTANVFVDTLAHTRTHVSYRRTEVRQHNVCLAVNALLSMETYKSIRRCTRQADARARIIESRRIAVLREHNVILTLRTDIDSSIFVNILDRRYGNRYQGYGNRKLYGY